MPPYIIKLSILCINLLSLIFAVFTYVEDTVLEILKLQTQVDMVPAPTRVTLGRKGRLWCGSYTEEREEF